MTHSVNAQAEIRVEEWLPNIFGKASQAASVDAEIDMLAEVLHAVVHAGAGVSFYTPFSLDEARAFWADKVLPQVHAGTRRVVVARLADLNRRGDRLLAQCNSIWKCRQISNTGRQSQNCWSIRPPAAVELEEH